MAHLYEAFPRIVRQIAQLRILHGTTNSETGLGFIECGRGEVVVQRTACSVSHC
jgi:hypothetical protein